MEPCGAVWRNLASLWRSQQLCDVCLVAADGRSVQAHRVVLAAASSYFHALFLGAGAQCAPPKLGPDGLPAHSFAHIRYDSLLTVLHMVYEGGGVELTAENVCVMLDTANYLDIELLRDACCQARPSPFKVLSKHCQRQRLVRLPPTTSDAFVLHYHFTILLLSGSST